MVKKNNILFSTDNSKNSHVWLNYALECLWKITDSNETTVWIASPQNENWNNCIWIDSTKYISMFDNFPLIFVDNEAVCVIE